MALVGNIITNSVMTLSSFTGRSMLTLTSAIGNSYVNHLKTAIVTTTDVGTVAGVGVGTGKILGLSDAIFQKKVEQCLSAFTGPQFGLLALAIAKATIVHILSAAVVTTQHPVVFVGTGVGQVTGLDANILSQMIRTSVAFKGGQDWPYLCDGLAEAFVTYIQSSSIANVAIVGSPAVPTPSPRPGVGTGIIS